jgi:hypothetical protein
LTLDYIQFSRRLKKKKMDKIDTNIPKFAPANREAPDFIDLNDMFAGE